MGHDCLHIVNCGWFGLLPDSPWLLDALCRMGKGSPSVACAVRALFSAACVHVCGPRFTCLHCCCHDQVIGLTNIGHHACISSSCTHARSVHISRWPYSFTVWHINHRRVGLNSYMCPCMSKRGHKYATAQYCPALLPADAIQT